MTDPIANSLNMRPIETIDNETGEIFDVPAVVDDNLPAPDPYFQEAEADATMVRQNIKDLIEDGMMLFKDVKEVALNTQDPEQYQAAARLYAEVLKGNKELMNVHRDIFAMKPEAVQAAGQQADTINNVFVATTSEELIRMLKEKGIKKLPSS